MWDAREAKGVETLLGAFFVTVKLQIIGGDLD